MTTRINNLKKQYRKHKLMGHPKAAQRVLDRLVELGVGAEEITALKMED